MPAPRAFAFSPSQHHRHVLEQTRARCAYDGGPLGPWRRRLRASLRRLLGDMPARPAPLRVRRLWSRPHPLGTIEKIVFTAEPHCQVPAYVCLPAQARPPYAFMICLQGHTSGMHNSIAVDREDETTPIAVEGDRDFALGCLRNGIAALCIEQRSQGERAERRQAHVSQNGCHDAMMQALMLGRTLIGERVYDVDRGIDYLASRGDADLRRIGVMGNSGGGSASIYAAALLPRIAVAMPSCAFCSFSASKMALYHCSCGYVPGMLKQAEMADILGLIAPRPVVVVAGRQDHIIPLAGVRGAFRDARRIYRAAGAEDRCHLLVGPEGHRFYADLAWPVLRRELERLRQR